MLGTCDTWETQFQAPDPIGHFLAPERLLDLSVSKDGIMHPPSWITELCLASSMQTMFVCMPSGKRPEKRQLLSHVSGGLEISNCSDKAHDVGKMGLHKAPFQNEADVAHNLTVLVK